MPTLSHPSKPSVFQDDPSGAVARPSKRRLRIVHIVSSLKVGGMEHFVVRLAAAQKDGGHDVSILALQPGALAEEAAALGLRVNVLSGSNKVARAVRGALLLKRLGADVAHAHNQTSLHYAALAKRVSSAQVVMTNHGQGQGSPRTPSAAEWRRCDAAVAVSQAVAERMDAANVRTKLSVIRNGVRPASAPAGRAAVRAGLGIADETVVGIIVARIDGLKGHDGLLRALALLPADTAGRLTVLVAGDGVRRAEVEALARELNLGPDRVQFLGSRSDIPDLLGAADFFVLPSLTEGLPLSVLEAMAQRLPVIATPVGGIPELVENHQHGLLVPVGDAAALADAVTLLARDPATRQALGRRGQERVEREFSFDAMLSRYDELYQNLCLAPRSRRP